MARGLSRTRFAGASIGLVVALAALTLAATPAVAKKKKPSLGPVVTATATAVLPPQTAGTVTATCPEGKKAVGGGFSVPFIAYGSRVLVYRSLLTGERDWSVTGVPNLSSPAATLTGFAYCRRVKKAIDDVPGVGIVPGSSPSSGTASATCTGKKKLISGGFEATSGPQFNAVALPSANHAVGNTWTVTAWNNVGAAKTLIAHAYCTKGVKSASPVSAFQQATVGQGSFLLSASPGCSGNKRLSGGGFEISPQQASGFVPVVTDSRLGFEGIVWFSRFVNVVGESPATLVSQGICTR